MWIVLSLEQCKLCCKDNSARHDRNRMKLHVKCCMKIQNLVERQVVCLKYNANIPRETFPPALISFDIDISWQCEVNTEPISNQKTCDINVNTTTLEEIRRKTHLTGKSFTEFHSFKSSKGFTVSQSHIPLFLQTYDLVADGFSVHFTLSQYITYLQVAYWDLRTWPWDWLWD